MSESDRSGAGEFDRSLRHAISLHPRPFQVGSSASSLHHSHSHHGSPHRSPVYLDGIGSPPDSSHALADRSTAVELKELSKSGSHGKSTSYEVTTGDDHFYDPVARHVLRSPPSPGFEEQNDLENGSLPRYTPENDPFELSKKIKSADEIERIAANTSRKRRSSNEPTNNNSNDADSAESVTEVRDPMSKLFGCIPSPGIVDHSREKWRARKLAGFYEAQNENIQRLLKPVDDHRREARDTMDSNQLKYKIAVQGSFIANVLLAGLQVFAAAKSGSLSLFTTMADALFDPMSNIMLMLSNRAVNRVDPRRFPSGKARIETAGNIVFCFIMTSVSLIIIVQSIEELIQGSKSQTKEFHLEAIIAVAVAFCTKLALFIYCFALRNLFSQIRILWEDHRNDLIINGAGLLTSLGGSYLRWWIDPAGAICLSLLIIFLWLRTAYSEFQLLIGVSADTNTLQLITYIAMTHSPQDIKAIDTVRSFHSGPRLIVEVDIVMDPDATLRHTHDTAEALQVKLESLPNVERAYVHVDFETDHAPEHFWKKEL